MRKKGGSGGGDPVGVGRWGAGGLGRGMRRGEKDVASKMRRLQQTNNLEATSSHITLQVTTYKRKWRKILRNLFMGES